MIRYVVGDLFHFLLYLHSLERAVKVFYIGKEDDLHKEISQGSFDLSKLPARSDLVDIEFANNLQELFEVLWKESNNNKQEQNVTLYIYGAINWQIQKHSVSAHKVTKMIFPILSLYEKEIDLIMCDNVDLKMEIPLYGDDQNSGNNTDTEKVELNRVLSKWFQLEELSQSP